MFQLEKEMIPILKRDLPKIFGSTHTAEEFVSGNGRPDLVFASASSEPSFWKGKPPDYETLHLLVKFLNKQGRVVRVDEVCGVDVKSHRKVQSIINTLSELGFVEYKDDNHIVVRRKYQPVAEHFVSIEAKLSDWKSGIYQAARYKAFSNSSYLAISEQYIENVDRAFLKECGVGLITVSDQGATVIVRAKKNKPSSIVSHYYLSERLIGSEL
jgi:hypothetical protein